VKKKDKGSRKGDQGGCEDQSTREGSKKSRIRQADNTYNEQNFQKEKGENAPYAEASGKSKRGLHKKNGEKPLKENDSKREDEFGGLM